MQPPQNPYSGQPQPTPPTPPQGRAGTVSTDAISEAWTVLKPNILPWVGAALVYFIFLAIFSGMSNAVTPKSANGQPHFGPISLITNLVGAIVSTFLGAGFIKIALNQLRTGRVEIGEMFNVFDTAVPLLIAAVLTYIATIVGFVLCIIPGIIVALGLSMTIPLIVDKKLDGIEAMKSSWSAVQSQFGSYFVVGLVLFLINIVGACACGVGILVTIPLSYLTIALIYRDLFLGGSISGAPPANNFTPPPIADPRG